MSRDRLVYLWLALLFACSCAEVGGNPPAFDAGVVCEDHDHDGFGRGCARGYDCNDDDPKSTTECRTCQKPELGCACAPTEGPIECFLQDKALPGGDVVCSEGTRFCRDGLWSSCEAVHEYVVAPKPDTQRVVDPKAGQAPCSVCDKKCFKVVDNLLADAGTAGGNVKFAPGGGLTLLPGDGGALGMTADAGPSGLTGCAAMAACCSTLSDSVQVACNVTVAVANNTRCDQERVVYCPPSTVSGPVAGCTFGSGADTDCDGIPNVVDSLPGKPIATSNNQTIFHQLDIGETGQNSLDITFKLRNADVYFLLDMTNTMKEERDNLISSLTNGNVVNCAHLNQCCNRENDAAKKKACQDAVAAYTNRAGLADDQASCLAEEKTYCPGGVPLDCPDINFDGQPDNALKEQGVVGATRCLVGSSWFGAGYSREIPIFEDPEGCKSGACGTVNYGDRDEHAFRHIVDMTSDFERVRTALSSMVTNGNWDEPEAGMMALYSLITGKGHYFGINRPSIPSRLNATGCPPNSFGYPCFRKDAIPIVVFFTDRPHHNGPDASGCAGLGNGCPYNHLTGNTPGSWTSGTAESASDKQATRVPAEAESFATAYNAGDLRGQYLSLVGDTRFMVGDYPSAITGCGADPAAPDALIRFKVGTPANATGTVPPINVNFHLTKDDVYDAAKYGTWRTDRTNDPSPATEFGSVISVFRGTPTAVSSVIDTGDKNAIAIASGPDSTYLTYTGKTNGTASSPGFLGGISGCGADGSTNQVLFTFRPTANAHIVVDTSESQFPTSVSLHQGLPSALPKNPSTGDGTSQGIVNTNDTFATANAVLSTGTIDGRYLERTGDTKVTSIHADYTAMTQRYTYATRTQGSNLVVVSTTDGLFVGMQLASTTGWAASPVVITNISGTTLTLSTTWLNPTDTLVTPIGFMDSLVGCGVDPAGNDAVFKFDVATPRRVRIDTEGSSFDTVISLHDAPPPVSVTKTDVSGNGSTPGYVIGDVTNASYTLSDVGAGTTAFGSSLDYQQCGAAKSAKDAAFTFQLSKPTHLSLEVTSSAWNPIVALFASQPGTATVLSNAANANDRYAPPSIVPFSLGDVYGQLDTRVTGSNLSSMLNDYSASAVGCGATATGLDQIFSFRPSNSTTVRIEANPTGGWLPVVSVFDDPPPPGGVIGTTSLFDASTVTLPDSNCLAYSFRDPNTGAMPHTYAVCPSRRYADDANARCVSAGMDYLASINSTEERQFLLRQTPVTASSYNFHVGGVDVDGDAVFLWRDGTALTYSNWASGEPNDKNSNNKCMDMTPTGTWLDGKCSSSGASTNDNAYYVCEDASPAVTPNEDSVSAYTLNPNSTAVNVTGSTRRMSSDYNGATLLSACGGTISAGDAVFKIVTGSGVSYPLSVDSAGSSYGVVLGLFDGSIDAAGYKACDAAGGAALTYTLLAGRTYYVLVKGNATSSEGTYKLKFSDTSALTDSGTRLGCMAGTASVPKPVLDVDVDANHTYYVVVDTATSSFGPYELLAHALYQSRAEVANSVPANETGQNAVALPDPYRSRVTVVDTSTAGMVADYGTTAICSSSAAAPDAVYRFTPSLTTDVKFSVTPKGTGLTSAAIGVFDGLPGTSATLHDLTASGNPNEALSSAEIVPLTGPAQQYLGNTSAMAANVDPSVLSCGAYPNGRDAVFGFHLAQTTSVELDASASGVTDPVINLFRSSPLAKPAQVTLENDSKQNADLRPAPTPTVTSSWLYYGADMTHLTAESQTQVSVAALNSEVPASNQPHDLGDVAGKRVTVSGGDTSPMAADYPGGWSCGASDAAPDAIYKFYSSTNATVHVKATPGGSFDTVLGLYDGTNGTPLRLSDVSSVTEDNACVAPNAPKNLTNASLKALAPMLAGAPAVNLNCGATVVSTTDPDGTGSAIASFVNWCGTQPLTFVQAQADGPELVVFVVQSLQIASGSSLRVLGGRPALFVVNGNVNIAGSMTATPDDTTYPNMPGAGGDFACALSEGGNAAVNGTNTGGGGGGGFGTAGGLGGYGSSNTDSIGGIAGVTRGTTTLVPLLGGCSGGHAAVGSRVGMAGGALQISATGSITISGTGSVAANGGVGAIGAAAEAGGSGGGSGGAILLQASAVSYTAGQVSARGGAGGQGVGTSTFNGGIGSPDASTAGAAGQNSGTSAGGAGGGGGYGRVVVVAGSVSLAPCTTATNENASSAWPITLDGTGRQYIERGNTSGMVADHPGMCGTPNTSPDAVYAFTLSNTSTVQIDARASVAMNGTGSNTVLGLYSAGNLGQATTPVLLENDTAADADARPAPTPEIVNNRLAYRGDLTNLTIDSQPQINIDNQGNSNEVIPTELPDPINRRVTVLNANTSAMSADYLAASCSMPAADPARDAVYRFVPSQSGLVRVSANYSSTAFDPVIALYRGAHSIIDERVTLINEDNSALAKLNADAASIKVYNLARTTLYAGPSATNPDYSVVVRDAKTPVGIARSAASTIPNGATVSVDYLQDSGAPLPISQQVTNNVDLAALSNPNENASNAVQVPVSSGQAYSYSGNTTSMTADVDSSLFTCGPPALTSNDATFDFSLDHATTVSISTAGSGYNAAIALFDSPYSRPSSSVLRSPAAVEQRLYDVRSVPGSPEATCSAYDYNTHRYWFCSSERPWGQAEGMCQAVGLHLVTIEGSFENAALFTQVQPTGKAHQIGFQETVPYTASWGAWTSGGGGTTGSSVSSRFTRWNSGEPNGLGDCVQMLSTGTWDDDDCSVAHGYVCELNNTASTPAVPSGATCGALLTYGGHTYRACTDTLNWDKARASCQSVGMDLVRVDDTAENDQVRVLGAGKPAWLGGNDSVTEGQWVWTDNAGFWLVTAYRNWFAGEPNQPTANPGSRMRSEDGAWVDTASTFDGYRYICEDPAPGPISAPPTATAPQVVDVFSSARQFRGSTESTSNSVGGFINCSATPGAFDAVFVLTLPYTSDLSVDITGSFANSVVGLFKGAISAQGQIDAGNACAGVSAVSPQLTATGLAAGTYYVVLTGAASAYGAYRITFDGRSTDAAAFRMENDTISDAVQHPLGSVDGTWLVKRADMSHLTPTLSAVRVVNMGANINDVTPQVLDPVNGYQVQVINGSTASLGANYPGGSCAATSVGPDAIYKFTPSASENMQVRLTTSGWPGHVVLYDGSTGAPIVTGSLPATPIDLAPGYANETSISAQTAPIGSAQAFLGNLTPMAADVAASAFNQSYNYGAGSPTACSADLFGHDAFFKFNIPVMGAPRTVEITSVGTSAPHTIALWDDKPFSKPSGTTGSYDNLAAADTLAKRLGTGDSIDDDWVVMRGDTTSLLPALGYTPFTESTSYLHDDTTHAIGNVKGKQVVTVNATTATLNGDYLATTLACGGSSDSARDAIFSFSHSTGGKVRLSLNNPNPAFIPNLALFKGAPNTAVGINPPETAISGNEDRGLAYGAGNAGSPRVFSGNTAVMTSTNAGSTFTQGTAYGSNACAADASGKDAFISFVVPGPSAMTVELSSVAAGFNHTIALWDTTPVSTPPSVAMSNDTRAAAYTAPIGAIDDTWVVRTATMSSLYPDGLASSSPGVSNNNNVQPLGDPVGKRINVAGNTSTAGVVGDYSAALMTCGSSDTANDIIYKITPTANTTVRVATNNPSNPGFSTALALFDGTSGDPQRISDSTASSSTPYCTGGSGFGYAPSNVNMTGISFTSAGTVNLNCNSTITFNSTGSGTWTNWCPASPSAPTAIVQTQTGGQEISILVFKSFAMSAGTTLNLTGSRPVVILVEGAVSVDGTINAGATTTTAGAGGNQSCGSSAGGNGTTFLLTDRSGAGGGGFGYLGGVGGAEPLVGGGAGGAVRGNATLVPLIGGCNGGNGSNCGGSGGAGGGAFQISAGGTLSVTGTLRADGGNATAISCGFLQSGGGAGGGSGGAILLEGASVTSTALSTKGGNGGSGSNGGAGAGAVTAAAGGLGGSNLGSGSGGGGGGYGRTYTSTHPCAPSIESFGTAQIVPLGLTQTYTGPSGAMTSDLTGTSFKYAGGCTPDTTGPDAFFKFTVTATTPLSVSSASTNYNHTITLFNSAYTSMQCSDGVATTGTTLTSSLSPGTYYVGIKSRNSGVGGSFSMAFTDTSSAGPYATLKSCTTSNTLDYALTSGKDYYVVVKGASAGLSGAYNLTITDIGAVANFGCSTDLSAPDAYFEFDVSAAAGRDVTIELDETGSNLDGAFQLVRDGSPYNNSTGDTTFACETSKRTYTALPQGKYYVAVRGNAVASGVGNKPAVISIRDESGMNALDCAIGTSSASGTITRTLQPGTYYAGITSRGGAAGGTYKLRLRDTSVSVGGGGTWLGCADSSYTLDYTIPAGDATVLHYVVVKGAAGGAEGAYTLSVTDLDSVTNSCASGDPIQMDPTAPDAYYAFKVADTDGDGRDVTLSLATSSALDGAYRLYHTNGAPVGNCHDRSAPFTYTNLPADTYYVVVRGKSTASGSGRASFELSVNDQDAYGSMACKDAAAFSGNTITRTLNAGNYWVGIKSGAGATNPMDYRLQFRDTANLTPTNATEVGGGCSTSVISAAVTAGTPYYVLVKGIGATDSGPYGLTLTDLTNNGGFGCQDDPAAGDAYFEFNVNDPNGRRVTIDTQNSALDTVVALFPAGQPIDATGYVACDDNSGATTGSSKITRDLAPGVYYVVVRAKVGTANPNLPFELSVRDDSTVSSIACGATDVTGPAQIRTQLGAGTYHVVLKGMPGSDKGAYKLRVRDEGPYENAASEVACNDTQNELLYNVTAGKPYYAVVKGAATNQSGAYKLTVENLVAQVGMGCNANPTSPDAVYRFHLSTPTRVQIDTIGSQTSGGSPVPTDTVIGLYDVSATYFGTNYAEDRNRTPVSCDDDSGDASKGWSRIDADLAGNRDYYVVVKSKTPGWGSSRLPYVVNVRDVNANLPIACADANSSLLMTRTLPAGDYRVVVSNSIGATGGAPFDVRFRNTSVGASGATQVACSDTPDELTYNVTAGRPYYLVVKGDAPTDRGQYGLVVETTGTGATSMGCGANPAAPDAFFKFNVTKNGPVVIDTNGSTADTVIALYPATASVFSSNYAQDMYGNVIPCDDDSGSSTGASRISATLAPGAYYLVVKGKTLSWNQTAQPFNVSIRDSDSTGSIACASASTGGKKLQQTLPAGDYNVVMSTTSAAGGAYSVKFRDTAKAGAETGTRLACAAGGSVTVGNLSGGHEYFVVVKGNAANDAGGYQLTLEDTVSLAAASGSTSIACAVDGSKIDGMYPAGTYYALVTGDNASSSGVYTLKASDVDALADQNREACNDDSGPNRTSVIERNVAAGTHYVVVKGKGADEKGAYALHVRDADAVPDYNLGCGGAASSERVEYDVRAGQDYTVLVKGDALNQQGQYTAKLYDQYGLQNNNGQRLTCVSDAQPTTLVKSTWHTKALDFNLSLTPDTYYVSVKGQRLVDKGNFQLQIGELGARTSTTYTPPSWTEVKDALAVSEVRVLPVIATGGDSSAFVAPAEEQAKTVALTTHAVRQDGSPIWQKIQADGRGTGSGLISGIAEIADYLSLDVSLVAVDGPDPGASRFRIGIAPVNSPSCVHPHPLVDTVSGVCTPRPNDPRGYNCNTQYSCAPGSAPKFKVTFTNPSDAPVPPNPNDPYGGYHFKMQIFGNKKYLLDEVPVYIIPTSHMMMGPPTGGSGAFQSAGTYSQDIDAASCPKLNPDAGATGMTNDLPTWSDLYFTADIPEGSSIDFELCTADTVALLTSCKWSDGTAGTRKKISVRSKGSCTSDTQCRNVAGYGNGFCSSGACQFIDAAKISYDVGCTVDSECPHGPLGAGDYNISSRCETTRGAVGYGHCIYTSQPADLGNTLLTGEQGRPYSRVKVTLHADPTGSLAPTLYQWYLTYFCKSAQ